MELLLASKTMPVPVVRAAVLAGARLLGENRVQELVAKAPELADLAPTWHVIGPLQSNKVNAALRWATRVQSVATLDLAERLSRRCETVDRDLEVMVQVNVSGEATKSGVAPEAAPRARHRGRRAAAAAPDRPDDDRRPLRRRRPGPRRATPGCASCATRWSASGAPGTGAAAELSMGMSGDLELAVAEGATVVRIGSAVFGPRSVI